MFFKYVYVPTVKDNIIMHFNAFTVIEYTPWKCHLEKLCYFPHNIKINDTMTVTNSDVIVNLLYSGIKCPP